MTDILTTCIGFPAQAITTNYAGSMMTNRARYPPFRGASEDANFGRKFCLRCHVPDSWLYGRPLKTDGSLLKTVFAEKPLLPAVNGQ